MLIMFEEIKEYLTNRKIKKDMIQEFMKEHKKYLPNYSPQGQRLTWNISVYQTGDYDIYTGKQSGEYKISVRQKSPGGITCDDNVYKYDIENKCLVKCHGVRWG